MPRSLHLLPMPREMVLNRGMLALPAELPIILNPDEKNADIFAARDFAARAGALCPTKFTLKASRHAPRHGRSLPHGRGSDEEVFGERHGAPAIRIIIDDTLFPSAVPDIREQAYRLAITPRGIEIGSSAPAGTFYAFQTLLQILREAAFRAPSRRAAALPCLTIADHPDFARRGFYHDTARGKVPKLKTLLQLVDDLAHLKYNEFQLYVENNFQFRRHPDFYNDTTPLTPVELQKIDAACQERHIDFVPSLTSLGHFDKILSRPRYRPLAEAEPAQLRGTNINPAWIDQAPWSLCVTDPRSKKLLSEMYDDFLPNFSSRHFNICCDESFDLGYGRSAKAAAKIGRGRLYLNWILFCRRLARRHGKSIQLWGDIIINHPELVSELPKDATLLEWGYEADHPFDAHCASFRQHAPHQPLYVCPGTSSWLTFASRSKNALANIHNAATAGLKHHARGILLTDWGDRGHQQMLAISLLSIGYAASASWNVSATPHVDGDLQRILGAISLHTFCDPSKKAAGLAHELGLTYERLECPRPNASADWFLFREPWPTRDFVSRTPAKALHRVLHLTTKLRQQFKNIRLARHDGQQLIEEFVLTCDEIRHTCNRTLVRQGHNAAIAPLAREIVTFKKRFTSLWRARNKHSRLTDVLEEFERLAREYAAVDSTRQTQSTKS